MVSYEPTELVVTVRAGTALAELEQALHEQGQMLPFEPPHFSAAATVGGTLAEIYGDASVRVAPTDLETALDMIEEVRGLAPIRGFRGHPKGDCQALAAAIVALSNLARLEPGQGSVQEAEINPLIIKDDGVIAVDGLVVMNQ